MEASYDVGTALAKASTPSTATEQVTAAATSAATTTATAANDDLVSEIKSLKDEVVQLRSENNSGHAAIAGNTGRIVRKLEDVTAASGGEAVSVVGAARPPLLDSSNVVRHIAIWGDAHEDHRRDVGSAGCSGVRC